VDVTELKAAEEAVRLQAQILDTTGESIIATDPSGKIIYMNRFAGTQFRVNPEEAIGADIMQVTVPSTSRQQAEEIMEALRRGEPWTGEFIASRRDGSTFPIRGSNTPLYDEAGELAAIVGVARDMTEDYRSQRALRESEERYRATFDQAAVGVCQIAFDGTFERVNPRLSELLGYSTDELLKLKFADITHPDDVPRSMKLVAELSAQQRRSFAIEKRYIHKDGQAIWALSTVSLMRVGEGQPQSLIAIVEDISAQKEAELALRQSEAELRALTVRLNTAREEEAKRIARELHDELGQALTAINIEAADAQRQLAEPGPTPTTEIQRRLASMRALLEQAIGTTRRVCTELRPALLDQVGLLPALEWQAHDFEARTGIFCNLTLPEPGPEITGEVATAVFRILQEMLTNAARHSGATEVTVDLAIGPERIRLTVHDNGRGTSDAQAKRQSGLGLVGIRERTLAIGGTVSFESTDGNGTRMSVVVPRSPVHAENG
jgi:two-component system sensor histidine kinase UhpB